MSGAKGNWRSSRVFSKANLSTIVSYTCSQYFTFTWNSTFFFRVFFFQLLFVSHHASFFFSNTCMLWMCMWICICTMKTHRQLNAICRASMPSVFMPRSFPIFFSPSGGFYVVTFRRLEVGVRESREKTWKYVYNAFAAWVDTRYDVLYSWVVMFFFFRVNVVSSAFTC